MSENVDPEQAVAVFRAPKLHGSTWPGLVKAKGEAPTSLDTIIELAANARSKSGRKLDGLDIFPFAPHFDFENIDAIREKASAIVGRGLSIGTLVAPVWPATNGGSSVTKEGRPKFLRQVRQTLKVAKALEADGVREAGLPIRIDTAEESAALYLHDTAAAIKATAATFDAAYAIAEDFGMPLVIELEVLWKGIHTLSSAERLLDEMSYPGLIQLDYSHILTEAFIGGFAGEDRWTAEPPSAESAFAVAQKIFRRFGKYVRDIHVAQSLLKLNALSHHGVTGAHALPFEPGGLVNFERFTYELWGHICVCNLPSHLCWDGCGWSTTDVESQARWNEIVDALELAQNGAVAYFKEHMGEL